jgi:membrane protein implicated in regulation of membrane protease activity
MTTVALLELIPNWILISVGLLFIGIEIAFGVFILFWFGLGLITVGLLGFFVNFEQGEFQLIFAFAIGIVLLFGFRKRIISKRNAEPETLYTYQTGDTGIVKHYQDQWMIDYHGTHWRIANPTDQLESGKAYPVKEIRNNQVWLDYNND